MDKELKDIVVDVPKKVDELVSLVNYLTEWQPDMSISGLFDFCRNLEPKTHLTAIYNKTMLELKASRHDGLSDTLEACFKGFHKDIVEREKKRFNNYEHEDLFEELLSDVEATKPENTKSSDIFLAVVHISQSKQLLIDVLKTIIQLLVPSEQAIPKKPVDLTDTESNILEALGNKTLTGKKLLNKAGYDYSSHYKAILSSLIKRGVLENIHNNGYKTK